MLQLEELAALGAVLGALLTLLSIISVLHNWAVGVLRSLRRWLRRGPALVLVPTAEELAKFSTKNWQPLSTEEATYLEALKTQTQEYEEEQNVEARSRIITMIMTVTLVYLFIAARLVQIALL